MTKRVLDIGNCSPDHTAIRGMLERSFDAEVTQAHGWQDASQQLEQQDFDLVLVNRVLDIGGGDGLEIVRQIKSDERTSSIPVMLITNFDEYHDKAVAEGAIRGFGKRAIGAPQTVELLSGILA